MLEINKRPNTLMKLASMSQRHKNNQSLSPHVTELLSLDRLDLEVQGDEGKNQTFQILNKIVEDVKSFRIITALDINKRCNLRCSEGDMLISHDDLKLLPSNMVRFRPIVIIFFQYCESMMEKLSLKTTMGSISLSSLLNPNSAVERVFPGMKVVRIPREDKGDATQRRRGDFGVFGTDFNKMKAAKV